MATHIGMPELFIPISCIFSWLSHSSHKCG